jgi:hypothetical protein
LRTCGSDRPSRTGRTCRTCSPWWALTAGAARRRCAVVSDRDLRRSQHLDAADIDFHFLPFR